MRQSLSPGASEDSQTSSIRTPLPLASLAGWCSQAAGAAPEDADPVSAAWLLLYASAHLFDSVQDGDPPDEWWSALGSGAAINVACGLLTSAWAILSDIEAVWIRPVRTDFSHTILRMGSGQHLDLTASQPSLDTAWRVAEAKSGAFFALACRCGARVAGARPAEVDLFGKYGLNLGLMIQIADDASDLQAAPEAFQAPALPVAYSLETASPRERQHMARSLETGSSLTGRDQLQATLARNGTALYFSTKLAQFRARGAAALEIAGARPPAADRLLSLLDQVVSDR